VTYVSDPNDGCIVVSAQIVGPQAALQVRLALATGATVTGMARDLIAAIGCDPGSPGGVARVTTGSQLESMPLVPLSRVVALGHEARHLIVLAHTLPLTADLDGVLGLDSLEGHLLPIDFRAHTLTLT